MQSPDMEEHPARHMLYKPATTSQPHTCLAADRASWMLESMYKSELPLYAAGHISQQKSVTYTKHEFVHLRAYAEMHPASLAAGVGEVASPSMLAGTAGNSTSMSLIPSSMAASTEFATS